MRYLFSEQNAALLHTHTHTRKSNFRAAYMILFLLIVASFSCEKADLQEKEADIEYTQLAYQGNNVDNLTNATIDVQVEDGMLSFPDVNAFYRAQTIIGNSDDATFLQWSKDRGFMSLWEEYSQVLEQFEELKAYSDEFLSAYPKGKYRLELYEDAYLLVPFLNGRSLSALVNTEGMVLIADQLHYFSDEYHVLVANKDKNLLREVLQAPAKDWNSEETGIVVTFQEQDSEVLEKVQVKYVNCPSEGVAHREEIGSGSNRKLMVCEMFTYIFTTEWSSTVIQYNASLRLKLYNYYRSGWSWQLTPVDLETVKPPNTGGRFVRELYSGNTFIVSQQLFISSAAVDNTYSNVQTVDNLVAALVIYSTPGLSQSRFFDQGLRMRGFRTGSSVTNPNLDITVGCN
jgi:hypothetical protein